MGLFDFAKNSLGDVPSGFGGRGDIAPTIFSTTDEKAPVEGCGMMTRAWGHL